MRVMTVVLRVAFALFTLLAICVALVTALAVGAVLMAKKVMAGRGASSPRSRRPASPGLGEGEVIDVEPREITRPAVRGDLAGLQ